MVTIRIATELDYPAICDLRVAEYRNAKEFTINNEELIKNIKGTILIVENSANEIIATMQIEIADDIEQLLLISNSYPPLEFDLFPTFYLGKSATERKYKNTGLNSLLRLEAIKTAIKGNEINSICGVVYDTAPRINLLKKVGYNFIEIEPERNYLIPRVKEYFIFLRRDQFSIAEHALKLLLTKQPDR